jgi:hypothetical protein
MYIVKNLKDYQLSHKQSIFAGYLKDNVDSYVCYEKITNRAAMRSYFAPVNDFAEYCTAIAEPAELLARSAYAS